MSEKGEGILEALKGAGAVPALMGPAAPEWDLSPWRHSHDFGGGSRRFGETRMRMVLAVTVAMMGAEIVAGMLFGSLALLSDGLHMASHAAALGIGLLAYVYARRHANDPRFAFGTGKVDSLAGFTSALALALFALWMGGECLFRFLRPEAVDARAALGVAVLGLFVNLGTVLLLREPAGCSHPPHGGCLHGHDHNLEAARLHLVADAVTSVLAILALVAVHHTGLDWLDPLAGLAGAGLITHWAWKLLSETSHVLLDRQALPALRQSIRESLERLHGTRLVALHIWSLGQDRYGGIISVVSRLPHPPSHYKAMLSSDPRLAHLTVEVNPCLELDHRAWKSGDLSAPMA